MVDVTLTSQQTNKCKRNKVKGKKKVYDCIYQTFTTLSFLTLRSKKCVKLRVL